MSAIANAEKMAVIYLGFHTLDIEMASLYAIKPLQKYQYNQHLGSLEATAILAQLFIIEQEYGFNGKSKYNPPSLYIQGWIRSFINSDSEIDILCRRICSFNPPLVKNTCCDDKNHSNYRSNATPLWYL